MLITLIATGVALGLSLSSEKQYDAQAQLLLRSEEPVTGLLSTADADPERELETAVELIETGGTVHEVRRRLRLDRTADELLDQVSTDTSADSDIVTVKARDHDARTAANIANAFADAFVRFRLDAARDRYEKAAQLAEQQILALAPEDQAGEAGRALRARRDELRITAALQTGGAQVVRRASIPVDPSRPRPLLSAVLGLVLGLVLGVGSALALELFDRRVKDEEAVEDVFGLPVLAAIPRSRRGATSVSARAQRESYGLLAANLRYSAPGNGSQVVLVSSASPAEGKTSVTLGLARAFAGMGLSVIAIEADLRRPAFERRASIEPGHPGLAGVLSGRLSLAEALVEVDADTLHETDNGTHDHGSFRVLPAGALPANPQRVLGGGAMKGLLQLARGLADVVLLDTAPAGTVNDALPLLGDVDSVLLVAKLGRTTRDAARRALRTLRNVRVEITGVVVTNAAPVGGDGYYAPVRDRAAAAGPTAGEGRDV